jgi:hypothetical protein
MNIENAGDEIKAGARVGVINTKDLGAVFDKEKLKS